MAKNYHGTKFTNEEINNLINYLKKYEGFTKNEKKQSYTSPNREFEPEEAQNYIIFPGVIKVKILKNKIRVNYTAKYLNHITNKNNTYKKVYKFTDIDEAIANISWYLNNNIITDDMVNTILFKNGKRIDAYKLERLRDKYRLHTKDKDETRFLHDCGFTDIKEYEKYILDIKAKNKI